MEDSKYFKPSINDRLALLAETAGKIGNCQYVNNDHLAAVIDDFTENELEGEIQERRLQNSTCRLFSIQESATPSHRLLVREESTLEVREESTRDPIASTPKPKPVSSEIWWRDPPQEDPVMHQLMKEALLEDTIGTMQNIG